MRRQALRVITSAVAALSSTGCIDVLPFDEGSGIVLKAPTPPTDWPTVARLAGLPVYAGQGADEIGELLNELVEQGVTVVEADSRLSEYLTDEEFESEVRLMSSVAGLARERNLKVVWYGTSLEVVSIGGEIGRSMSKDHPDWVQLSWNGTPNVFYGSKVFWIEPGDESAWMSPRSGYREYFFSRLEAIAASGIDGFWLDVPLYNDVVGRWASYNPADIAQFETDTGLLMPKPDDQGRFDPADPIARAWIWWRHVEIDRFLKEARERVLAVNPNFKLIVETVTMDYNAAILEGLDGAMQGPLENFHHVWEVDVLSDDSAMARGQADDFYNLIAMYKFGRGADQGRGAWAFSYGQNPDDAEVVMASCFTAGVNPYELKVPEMTSTVGVDYRTRMFKWLEANEDLVFRSESKARVALLHSSASRAVIDSCMFTDTCGVSLFTTWKNPEAGKPWWTTAEGDSVRESFYMAEYRGMVKALVQRHVPFDLLPSRLITAADAARYDVIIAPALEAVSDAEAAVLRDFAEAGGEILFTHSWPGLAKEDGSIRPTGAFADVLPPLPEPTVEGEDPLEPVEPVAQPCSEKPLGKGTVRFCPAKLGKQIMRDGDAAALDEIDAFARRAEPLLTTTAPPTVYAEAKELGDRQVVQFVNFSGADGTFAVESKTFEVRLNVGSRAVTAVTTTSARGGDGSVDFRKVGDEVVFDVTVDVHRLVVVELGGAGG